MKHFTGLLLGLVCVVSAVGCCCGGGGGCGGCGGHGVGFRPFGGMFQPQQQYYAPQGAYLPGAIQTGYVAPVNGIQTAYLPTEPLPTY